MFQQMSMGVDIKKDVLIIKIDFEINMVYSIIRVVVSGMVIGTVIS